MRKKRLFWCVMVSLSLICSLAACGDSGNSTNLMRGIRAEKNVKVVSKKDVDEKDVMPEENRSDVIEDKSGESAEVKNELAKASAVSITDFAVRLFQESLEEDKNTLISPLSVISALGMTANGAKGDTLAQMEQTFGVAVPDLNQYLRAYMENLPEDKERYKLSMANAIWFRDTESLTVEKDFLLANANFYDAAVKKASFNDATRKEINEWISDNTDGMINDMLQEISPTAMMYLVNALAFDAEWQKVYYEHQVLKEEFTKEDGTRQNVQLMHSQEHGYIEDDNAVGFIKYYADKKYAFVALLPNEGVTVSDYVESLTGEKFHTLLTDMSDRKVFAAIPKFQSEYTIKMNDTLINMGMNDAFDMEKADFTAMGSCKEGNLFIGQVLHKTFIAVDELGTKAGAATLVAMEAGSEMMEEPAKVYLNRPFVYMIVDCEEMVPVFIGVVRSVE